LSLINGKALVRDTTELIGYPSASGDVAMDNITSIGERAFFGCTGLESVSFPDAQSIGFHAFFVCANLTSANLPAATSIDRAAFSYCTSLESISLPAAISISYEAFERTGTTALTITLGQNAPTVEAYMFRDIDSPKSVTVKVPSGASGYGSLPTTYSSDTTTQNWGNAFRGKGWYKDSGNYGDGTVNSNITLTIQQE
jgi:hypothetical protein